MSEQANQQAAPSNIVVVGPDGMAIEGAEGDHGERPVIEMVEQPAKVMRIGSMIRQLLDEVKAARFSARLIQKLRARLGLSQMALGRLVGVSGAAVVQWERGRASPSAPNRKALVALRKRGRREVKRLLERVANPARTRPRRAPKRGRRQGRRGGR